MKSHPQNQPLSRSVDTEKLVSNTMPSRRAEDAENPYTDDNALRWLINNTEDAFLLVDRSFNVVIFNRNFQSLYERHFELELKRGSSIISLVEPEQQEELRAIYLNVLNGKTEKTEMSVKAGESVFVYSLKYRPAYDENRDIVGVLVTLSDITELKRVHVSESRLRDLLVQAESISHVGSFEFAWDVGISQWSQEFARICGIDNLVEPKAFSLAQELIHIDDQPAVFEALDKCRDTGAEFDAEFRICRRDGVIRYVKCVGRMDPLVPGVAPRLVGIMNDITEERATNLRLLQTMDILNDRVREQTCLYQISNLASFDYNIDVLLQIAVEILPSGFRIPRQMAACISFDGKEYVSQGFRHDHSTIAIVKRVNDDLKLEVKIARLKHSPGRTQLPTEEYRLIDTIATNLTLHLGRKLAQQAFKAGNDELRKIMDSSPDLVCTVNRDGYWQKVGAGSRMLLGYEPHEMEGRHFSEFIVKDSIDAVEIARLAFQSGKTVSHVENLFYHKNGHTVPVNWSARWDEDDGLCYCIGRDAKRLKAIENALRDEKERYAELFRNAPGFICILSGNNFIVDFNNPQFEQLAGTRDVVGRSIFDFISFDQNYNIREKLRQLKIGDEAFTERELPVQWASSPDYQTRYINFVAQPYRNFDGDNRQLIVYGIDVSLQVEARQQLEASVVEKLEAKKLLQQVNKDLDQLLQSTAEGIFGVDKNGICTFINRSGAWMLGYAPGACTGRDIHSLIHHTREDGSSCNGEDCPFNMAVTARQGLSVELDRFWRSDGLSIPVRFTCNPIIEDGETVGAVVAFSDISEQLTAQKSLQRLQANQEALINSTDDLVWSVDAEFQLITANLAFINQVKRSTNLELKRGDDLLMREHYPISYIDNWQELYERALEGESFSEEVYKPAFKNHPESWAQVRFNPIYGAERVIGVACFSRDITRSKQSERQILAMNQRLENAQQIARLGYWEMDMKKPGLYWSREVYAIFGLDPDTHELSFDTFNKNVHPDDIQLIRNLEKNVTANGGKLDFEHRIILPDGSIRYLHQLGEAVRDKDGSLLRLEGTTQDVTERKLALQRLEESEARYRYLFRMSPMPKWVFDLKTLQILEVNQAAIEKYGYSRETFLDKTILDFRPDNDRDRAAEAIFHAVQGTTMNFGQWRHVKANGEIINVEIAGHIMTENNREVMMSVAMDVTERVKIMAQLEELNRELISRTEQLAESNVELERFAYVASHDLQEPLRMVSSFLQLLKKKYDSNIDETGQSYIDFAVNGAERMKSLIKDLLEYSRLDSKPLEPTETDMAQVVQEVIYTLEDRIRQCNATVDVGPLPIIMAHRTQMFQLMQNLVSNGLKYNKSENPVVRINALDQSDHWLFEVQDNGIGIEEKYFNKIFVIFQRLHQPGQYSGTGIGLSVCKKIVERAGGEIWVKSMPGSGSTFYFTIPKSGL